MIRKSFRFYGRVQGVGFRRTAINAASSLGVTGWVRNERDGSVSMEAQGFDVAIERLIDTIRNGRYISIERIEATDMLIVDNEDGFAVKWA